jgi:hypothetical protein
MRAWVTLKMGRDLRTRAFTNSTTSHNVKDQGAQAAAKLGETQHRPIQPDRARSPQVKDQESPDVHALSHGPYQRDRHQAENQQQA